MLVSRPLVPLALALAFAAPALAVAQDSAPPAETPAAPAPGRFDANFLFSYYDQDGDHSPVTGGVGTEALQVFSPVLVLAWRVSEDWTLAADVGVDQISSASLEHIEDNVSKASIPGSDTRTFAVLDASRQLGRHRLGASTGYSKEYDYQSIMAGLEWSVDLAQKNTTLGAALRHYEDSIDLTDIDGYNRGEGDRQTTDLSLTLSQVLSRRTVGSLELFHSAQSGFLSTPFHEVFLQEGERVAERLPDSRARTSVGVRLNHAFTERVVQRAGYRFYRDDWGIAGHTLDVETHLRLPGRRETWLFPFARYHLQSESDYFGELGTLTGTERYVTSDWDLAEVTTAKLGLGLRVLLGPRDLWWLGIRSFETRLSYYDRDDGLSGFTTSFGLGWGF